MVNPIIAPSILSGDYTEFAEDWKGMLKKGADWLHIDVMDGHFVPNLTFGPPVVKAVRKKIPKGEAFFDCHMMVLNPQDWVEPMAEAGADQYTFHYEAQGDVNKTIEMIHKHKMRCGLAIKPGTNPDVVLPYLDKVDEILVMTVEPGFGGQKFMGDMLSKVKYLRPKAPHLDIEVDGGITADNVCQCAAAGANVIVSGTGVYGTKDPRETIKKMREIVQKAIEESDAASS